MSASFAILLPRKFVTDREERDLPCGATTAKGQRVLCVADAATLKDMAEDADYQARFTDAEDLALKRSAARACDLLVTYMAAQGLPAPRLGA